MKKVLSLFGLSAMVCIFAFQACAQNSRITASSNIITVPVNIGNTANEILLQGSLDVEYIQSTDGSSWAEIVGPDNIVEHVSVRQEGSVIIVRFDKNFNGNIVGNHNYTFVRITTPSIRQATLNGSGDLKLIGNIGADDLVLSLQGSGDVGCDGAVCKSFTAKLNGSGDITVGSVTAGKVSVSLNGSGDINVNRISAVETDISLNGSGDIRLNGNTENVIYQLSGSGDIWGKDFMAKFANATLRSSGDIRCSVSERLDATVNGSGDITYYGLPTIVNKYGRKDNIHGK